MTQLNIYELTLRDGLMVRPLVPRAIKLDILDRLFQCNVRNFEVVRFPLDGKYPQFDDAIPLLEDMQPLREAGANLAVFAMGEAGIIEALRYNRLFDQLHIPCFVSDNYAAYAFGDWNWERSLRLIDETLQRCQSVGVELTIGLGTSFGCPFQTEHYVERTLQRFQDLVHLGIDCIMLGDTAGTATPNLVKATFLAINSGSRPETIRVHFHNTFGRALLNSWTALEAGADGVDTSLLGLGGEPHPYFVLPQQVDNGNCATEEIFNLLLPDSYKGSLVESIFETGRWFADLLGENIPGRACFAQFIHSGDTNTDEIPQGSYRH